MFIFYVLFVIYEKIDYLCAMKRTHRASYSVAGQADGLRPFLFSLFHQRNYNISKNEKRGL